MKWITARRWGKIGVGLAVAMVLWGTGCSPKTKDTPTDDANKTAEPEIRIPDNLKIVGSKEEAEEEMNEMASLAPSDTALQVGDLTITWGQLLSFMKKQYHVDFNKDRQLASYLTKIVVKKMLYRELMLEDARSRGVEVSKEDEEHYLKMLAEAAEKEDGQKTLERFLSEFPKETSNPLEISYGDMLKLAKYNDTLVKDIVITEEELEAELVRVRQADVQAKKDNEEVKQKLGELLDLPEMQTDEGFAGLARTYSDGTEAARGGYLGYFTRQQAAEGNELEEFPWNAGEVTPVIETSTGFRIMRVMDVISDEGGEKLKLAQILQEKRPLNNIQTLADLRPLYLKRKQQELLNARAKELVKAASYSCPLFPKGL
jgi:hypothetical protein